MENRNPTAGIRLVLSAFDRSKATRPLIEWEPQKALCAQKPLTKPLERSTPGAEGADAQSIAGFFEELVSAGVNLHGVMILKNGKVIAESYRKGYSPNTWHATFSLCKTVVGMAIGMLVDEGRLDISTPLRDIFADQKLGIGKKLRSPTTVRHLLNMTSGAEFSEAGAVTGGDWVSSFFSGALKYEPGKKFNYNSMNSYMLAAVVQKITGETLCSYLEPRLFRPLGIDEFHWESCPKGIEKGGWGMYLKLEDMAKLGQLLLGGGSWQGRQLISEKWVREMTSPKVIVEQESTRFDYGYQIWVGKKGDSFLLNGLFGQNVVAYRSSGMVIAAIGGSDEAFHEGDHFRLLEKYFSAKDSACAGSPAAERRLRRALSDFSENGCLAFAPKSRSFTAKRMLKKQLGVEFVPQHPEPALGVLPLITHMVQNNYPSGIEAMSFDIKGDRLLLTLRESGRDITLPFGFKKPIESLYELNGEQFICMGSAKVSLDEDRDPVLAMQLDLVETVSTRFIKVAFKKSGTLVKMWETPGPAVIQALAVHLLKTAPARRIVSAITSKVDLEYLRFKLSRAMEPEFMILPKA